MMKLSASNAHMHPAHNWKSVQRICVDLQALRKCLISCSIPVGDNLAPAKMNIKCACETTPSNCTQHRTTDGSNYQCSVPVEVTLERSLHANANVICLLLGELGQFRAACWQVQGRNLLVEMLGQQIHFVLVCLGLPPILEKVKLPKHLDEKVATFSRIGGRPRHTRTKCI